jgi:hypothetical protein
MFKSVGWPLLRAEGIFCTLDILYGGLGIGSKLQFKVKFLVIKALDPDWILIRIGIQQKMLDPDPDEMNADPQPCLGGPASSSLAEAMSRN